MKRKLIYVGIGLLVVGVGSAAFQGCGSDPKSNSKAPGVTNELSSTLDSTASIALMDPAGQPVPEAGTVIVGKTYRVKADFAGEATTGAANWNVSASLNDACHLDVVPGDDGARDLICDDPGAVTVTVSAQSASSSSSINGSLRRYAVMGPAEPGTTPTPPPPGATPTPTPTPAPNIVMFSIPAGTGNQPYNTLATAVKVTVGQTLRIVNNDTVNHRLHTGGAPCGHQPNNTPPGGFFDCVISRTVSAAAGANYDHIAGTNAKFYIEAVAAPAAAGK